MKYVAKERERETDARNALEFIVEVSVVQKYAFQVSEIGESSPNRTIQNLNHEL